MKKYILLVVLLATFSVIGAADKKHSQFYPKSALTIPVDPTYQAIVNQVSADSILSYLQKLESFGVKSPGSAQLDAARDWLKNKYLAYGYTDVVYHDFTYSSNTLQNIVTTKTGSRYPDTYLIIDGHYDTIGGPGVNDNGSGTAILLEIARVLASVNCGYSIRIINFSAEEQGLIGSSAYVNTVAVPQNMDIKLVFNIDEVGGIAGSVNNTVTCERDEGSPSGNNAASAAYTDTLAAITEAYTSLNTQIAHAYGSDYMPFEDAGYVITGFYETNESPYPHGPNDVLANMDPQYVYEEAKAAVAAALYFSGADKKFIRLFHDPILLAQSATEPYPLEIGVMTSSAVTESKVFYTINSSALDSAVLTFQYANDDTLVYQGEIPAQPFGSEIDYYFKFNNGDQIESRLPEQANTWFSFVVQPDTIAPQISHIPLSDQSFLLNPLEFSAQISDQSGVQSVSVYIKLNSEPEIEVPMEKWIGDEFRAEFTGNFNPGDIISYRFKAADKSSNNNIRWLPENSYYQFELLNSELFDFEVTGNLFSGSGDWQWGQLTDGTLPAAQGNNVWATALDGNYASNLNSALESPLIDLQDKQDIKLHIRHFYQVEPVNDGGNLKVSADGINYQVIVPDSGYPVPNLYLFGEPGYSGNSYFWQDDVFDLSAFEGQQIYLKFDFRSDIFTTRKGWYIDHIRIDFRGQSGNRPPQITYFYPAELDTVEKGKYQQFRINAIDPDSDSLSFRFEHGAEVVEDSVATFVLDRTGPDTVFASVSDPYGRFAARSWIFYVKDQVTAIVNNGSVPETENLHPIFPNPFNPSTIIKYDLPQNTRIKIRIYNSVGQLVKEMLDEYKKAGTYQVRLQGGDLSSGIYFVEMQTLQNRFVRRALLIK